MDYHGNNSVWIMQGEESMEGNTHDLAYSATLSLLEQFNHNDAMTGASVGIAGVDPLPACMMFFEVCFKVQVE